MTNYKSVLCDANVLYRAYKASVKNSKWKESNQRYSLNFLKNLFKLQDELMNKTLKNGVVDEFEMRERGKVRPISSLSIQDRIVRHALCDEVLLPKVERHIIYDNGASIKGRGVSHARKRFEVHLRKYYQKYGNKGYILFGDFTKFYDNIIHEKAKNELLKLVDNDAYVKWLLDVIFSGFEIDVSYMSDEEYSSCLYDVFDKLKYREIPKEKHTGDKKMLKSVNIGDQLSQIIGVYYPHRIDSFIKYVKSQKYYGRYMDDWYIMSPSKEELIDILEHIKKIASEYGIHINMKKTRIVKISDTYKFLQTKYSLTKNGQIIKRINPKRITDMRRKLKKLAVKVQNGERLYENVEGMFRGWMCDYYKIMSRSQRNDMLRLYEELFNKSIDIVNKRMIFHDRDNSVENS